MASSGQDGLSSFTTWIRKFTAADYNPTAATLQDNLILYCLVRDGAG